MNFLFNKKLLISTLTIFTLCITDYTIGADLEDREKGVRKGNLTNVTAGGNISQTTNEHKGGEGGAAHITVMMPSASVSSPHTEREKRPDEYFAQGETFISKKPPSWEDALEVFMYAANAEPPHALACVRCAEYFQGQSSFENAQIYYERALLASGVIPPKVYQELMKLHYGVGINSNRKKTKESNLQKARDYGEKISRPTAEEDSMLDDIDEKLSQLGIGTSGAGGGVVAPSAAASLLVSETSSSSPIISQAASAAVVVASKIAQPVAVVERPVSAPRISIPAIARGSEAIYERFLRGKLIYRPTAGSDVGKVELAIADFVARGQNPLESMFDLSRCGDAAKYLSVSTGYRREATKSANPSKWEVFITPKFLIEAHKSSTASHYAAISNASWTAPFAVIQNYGGWSDINRYCYHVSLTDADLNSKNLYQISCQGTGTHTTLNIQHYYQKLHKNFYLLF